MTLKLIALAGLILAALGAIWIFVVIPSEKRHHQRRIELVQQKLERLEAQKGPAGSATADKTRGKNS
jgi:hypothetical protein